MDEREANIIPRLMIPSAGREKGTHAHSRAVFRHERLIKRFLSFSPFSLSPSIAVHHLSISLSMHIHKDSLLSFSLSAWTIEWQLHVCITFIFPLTPPSTIRPSHQERLLLLMLQQQSLIALHACNNNNRCINIRRHNRHEEKGGKDEAD